MKHFSFDAKSLNELYRYSLALCGDPDDAHDLLYSVIATLMQRSVIAPKQPMAYARRCLYHRYVDLTRRDERIPMVAMDAEQEVVSLCDPDLEDIVVDRNTLETLLGSLSGHQRGLLYLWAVEGYTVQELADHLNKPKGTLLSQLHRLKRKIQATAKVKLERIP